MEVFESEDLHIDPALNPTLAKGGKGGFSGKNKATIHPELKLEDLRRELVTRKYSYKTVKPWCNYPPHFGTNVAPQCNYKQIIGNCWL